MLFGRIALASVLGPLVFALGGCRSVPPQSPLDFSGPGWVVRQGQAVWTPHAKAVGVAGELLVAMHPDGRCVVQFIKTPLPFLVAQRTTNWWKVQIVPRDKTYTGRGAPPERLIWLHLPEALGRQQWDASFVFRLSPGGEWRFENDRTGESLEGYLSVTTRPDYHVVRTGETLTKISLWYGVPVKTLWAANPGLQFRVVRVSESLRLPAAVMSP